MQWLIVHSVLRSAFCVVGPERLWFDENGEAVTTNPDTAEYARLRGLHVEELESVAPEPAQDESVDLHSMTKAELVEYAQSLGLSAHRRMRKDEIIALIEEAGGAGTPD